MYKEISGAEPERMKKIIRIITLYLAIITIGCGRATEEITLSSMEPSGEGVLLEEEHEEWEDTENLEISVYICGAVISPGVYEFTLGDRVTHGIEKAGGFTSNVKI